jgi:hypothetical protein
MRKIDLKPYQWEKTDYKVVDVLTALLFNPDLKLAARDLIAQDALAKKIETSGESVILEEADYQKVKRAVETIKGWQRGDIEFVTRILDAPEIPVKEA